MTPPTPVSVASEADNAGSIVMRTRHSTQQLKEFFCFEKQKKIKPHVFHIFPIIQFTERQSNISLVATFHILLHGAVYIALRVSVNTSLDCVVNKLRSALQDATKTSQARTIKN